MTPLDTIAEHAEESSARSAPRWLLTRLVDSKALQEVQERFAALGRTTVCLCSTDGVLITTPTWGSPFSSLIGSTPRGRQEFLAAIQTSLADPGGETSVFCNEGMSVYTSPIRHGESTLAVLVVGTRKHPPPSADEVVQLAAKYDIDPAVLDPVAAILNPARGGSLEDIHEFADSLALIIATLYDQAERIERQLVDLRTVHGLTELLSGSFKPQQILDLTVRRVVHVMPIKACGIRLLNEETGELVVKAVYNLSEKYLGKGPVLLRESAIDSAAFAGQTVYIENAQKDPRIRYPKNAIEEGIVSGLCVPMTYRGKTVGVLRVYTSEHYKFSESEEALLRSIASQAASSIINATLYEENVKVERVRRQVSSAAAIQRRMIPAKAPKHDHLDLGCIYDPTLELGGDFYDFIKTGGGLAVCIADVVGKGMPAALMMASIRAVLRAHLGEGENIAGVLSRVNKHMHRELLTGEFVTLFLGVFSRDGRTLTYVNAGHPPPLLLRNGQFLELDLGGTVLGIDPEESYESSKIELLAGDTLVMITDGVTEAMNFQGQAYGSDRFRSSIHAHRGLAADPLAQQILWDVRRFVGLTDQSDDITIVVAKTK